MNQKKPSYFPIKIAISGVPDEQIINSPEELPNGVSFKVLQTNINHPDKLSTSNDTLLSIMRQYFIVENNDEYNDDYVDYIAGPMGICDAYDYLHTHQLVAKVYNYRIVYRDIPVCIYPKPTQD